MIQIVGNPLNQWDVGRLVQVTGEASHVHFANQGDSVAVIIDIVDGKAKIPDYLLQTGKTLFAYSVLNGVTQERVVFTVRKRERPENYVYDDDQRNYIYALIRSAEEATAEAEKVAEELRTARDSGEFNGPPGPPGPQGDPGGSTAPLIVTEEDVSKASHNYGEISSHVLAGGDVFFDSSIGYIALNDLSHTEGLAIFAKVGSGGVNIFMVDSEGNLDTLSTTWATADQIGYISSALDVLHDYAEGLIKGGATE